MDEQNLTRILKLHGLQVECSIGIYDHERTKKQRVIIDVAVRLSAASEPREDSIKNAFDYDALRDCVLGIIATGAHFDLQETLARRIFDSVSALDTSITGVAVETRKPDAYGDAADGVSYRLSDMD